MHRTNEPVLGLRVSAALLLLGLPQAWGQARPPSQEPDQTTTFRTSTRLVVLYCGVYDKHGRMVTDLPLTAFKVYENNVEQQIRIFRREDIPISLGIVIDNSGSMRDKRQKVETASVRLVRTSKRNDEVFIVNFNDEAYLDVPFTSSLEKMEEGVARIDSRGGTALRDAISMSIDYLKTEGKKDKKVLLVVTDGNDTASMGITIEKLVEKAQKSGVLIYGIGILGEEDKREARKAKRILDALTKASGGASYYPDSVDQVDATAEMVANDIRNQYVIAYSPSDQSLDGSYRQIKVTAGNRFTVRARSGYYATPDEPVKPRTPSPTGPSY
jgi:Ca-activated chloride channel family protein